MSQLELRSAYLGLNLGLRHRPSPEQGWSLLCNGVIIFDDTGELLPDGRGFIHAG